MPTALTTSVIHYHLETPYLGRGRTACVYIHKKKIPSITLPLPHPKETKEKDTADMSADRRKENPSLR